MQRIRGIEGIWVQIPEFDLWPTNNSDEYNNNYI